MRPLQVSRIPGIAFLVLAGFPAFTQKLSKSENIIAENIRSHISYLADDKLEGRRFGSAGEKLAAVYISENFQKTGLQPTGEKSSFFQDIILNDGRFYAGKSYLRINGDSLEAGSFFPLPGSPEKKERQKLSIAIREIGAPWFLDLKDDLAAAVSNPGFNFNNYISSKSKTLAKKGATSILLYNSNQATTDLVYDPSLQSEPLALPVIFVSREKARKYFSDETATLHLDYNVAFFDSSRVATNVLGYIDNKAANTIIFSAHYDHLGQRNDGTPSENVNKKTVYNGADDNASGVAGMLELARLIKASRLKKYNYLFAAFTGTEAGLRGSGYFVSKAATGLDSVDCLINLEMIGRLDPDTRRLIISGAETSPEWMKFFTRLRSDKNFVLKYESGVAATGDHTSFYQKKIPALTFSTGEHSDYHQPTDDADKINYRGETKLISYLFRLTELINAAPKLVSAKTQNKISSLGN